MLTFWITLAQRLSDGGGEDVGVTGVDDGHGGAAEQLSSGCSQLDLQQDVLASVRLSEAVRWGCVWMLCLASSLQHESTAVLIVGVAV